MAATRCFTEFGYEGTSVDRLVETTGVPRASLYSVFGSKHHLFLACLRAIQDPRDQVSLDLLLVALLKRSPRDRAVRAACADVLTGVGDDGDLVLGRRLIERAGIPPTRQEQR